MNFSYIKFLYSLIFVNNITYIEQFPGLIHFIYIDRRTNQVTAPSFNITSGETNLDAGEITNNEMDATKLLKDKVRNILTRFFLSDVLYHTCFVPIYNRK